MTSGTVGGDLFGVPLTMAKKSLVRVTLGGASFVGVSSVGPSSLVADDQGTNDVNVVTGEGIDATGDDDDDDDDDGDADDDGDDGDDDLDDGDDDVDDDVVDDDDVDDVDDGRHNALNIQNIQNPLERSMDIHDDNHCMSFIVWLSFEGLAR